MDLTGKTLLVLSGCNGAYDIIEYAKRQGVTTIATDYHPQSSVKDLAHYKYDISTTNIDKLLEIAKNHSIDGVTTGTSEASMYSILKITSKLGLPFYATDDQLEKVNNKKNFKKLLKDHSVPVIPAYNENDNWTNEEIPLPVIIKPVDSSGAKGISVACTSEELQKSIQYALNYSRDGDILIEKYMAGLEEVFFNYTIIDGNFSLSSAFDIIRCKTRSRNDLVGMPLFYNFPSRHLDRFRGEVDKKLVSALASIGIQNGTMSIQCFVDESSFYIYEAGYRLGGAQMYIFTKELTGISAMEMMVNFSLTGKMATDPGILESDKPNFEQPCAQLNIPVKPGIIGEITGLDEVRKMSQVLNITQVHYEGDPITEDGSIGQLCLRIHVIAQSKSMLKFAIDKIYRNLTINDLDGKDMILEKYHLEAY